MPKITIDVDQLITRLDTEARSIEHSFKDAKDKGDQIVEKVTGENRDFTDAETKALAEHQKAAIEARAKVDAIRQRIEQVRAQVKLGESVTAEDENVKPEARSKGIVGGEAQSQSRTRTPFYATDEYRDAFGRWLRRGIGGVNSDERDILHRGFRMLDDDETRDMGIATGAGGGFTVPIGFLAEWEKALKSYSGVLNSPVRIMPTQTGNDLQLPTVNDTSNVGELLAENVATTALDVAVGQITFKSYVFSAKQIPVSNQLLQDNAVGLEQEIRDIAAERIGRIVNQFLTTGTGTAQPQGIVTASTLGKTAASATAITYDELIDLEHSVDPAYRNGPGVGFMMNDTVIAILRKLKDADGRPIWQPAATSGMVSGVEGLLNGRKYYVNQDMASPAATAKSIVFGDLYRYCVRQINLPVIARADELGMAKNQKIFFMFARYDGRYRNAGTNPIKHLAHP